MKIQTRLLRKTALAAAVTLVIGGVASMSSFMGIETGMSSIVSTAYAAKGDGQGAMGAGGQGGQGGQAAGGQGQRGGGQGQRGGKSVADVLADEADDDSDRPAWAQGNNEANPHSPGGGGQPDGAGTMKGDDFGDLIVLLRDLETGEPVRIDGLLQVCTDAACTSYVPMTEDDEVPAGVTPIEVDFGRASVARAPSKVDEQALAEALDKLTADGVEIGTDPAGRITFEVDGVISTIDSPLENLALYIDLMTGLASESTSDTEAALGDLATLDTAASLMAGVADKTGDITLDYVVYQNVIAGVVDSGDYYDFSSFTTTDYTRDYSDNYTYFLQVVAEDGTVSVEPRTLDINAYLEAINDPLPATDGAALFAAAADDALEVIELVHTQIVTGEELPGTQ